MKIQVNKTAIEQRKEKYVQNIINQAHVTAESGKSKFYIDLVRDELFSTSDIVRIVTERTEGTVQRGMYTNGQILMKIKT